MTDDEQAAPRRMRRARSGRQEQRLSSAAREKVRRRHVPEDDDELEDDETDDELDDEPEDEQERRPRPRRESAPRRRTRPAAERNGREERDEKPIPASVAARLATKNVVEFTGRELENVVAIECRDGDWYVDVEVVESHRIPDTTDILAIYQVRLDRSGDLLSYNRTRRYSRGQLDKESR
ncbi:gas vesicle protein GvpO [Pseudonocardia alaniniphila]|uniref:Gas vesicle protein n=1 Tax=Pseudonocardia alaniniphila TaxID=75291 RepID=A0ABS9TG43_9PSEU|nr:gas vesicle protein GvpO [Pseudonocardia alaniniphila]MCH6167510.1 gas vesicle protein [Pseudonocardia alaniniphila]